MKCPYCSFEDSKVVDSRNGESGCLIRRRRECLKCEKRFTTYERVEVIVPLIIKKDGRRETFDSAKLKVGLQKACEKRPIAIDQIEKIVLSIEKKLQELSEKEVPSEKLGEFVMQALKDLDQVAYVRFASVYRQFKDISQFVKEIQGISSSATDTIVSH